MTTRKLFSASLAKSAIAFGVAAALRSTAAWSQTPPSVFGYEAEDDIVNPTTGATEKIKEVILNPYGLVLTYTGHYVWAGPKLKDATFTVPATPAIEPHPEVPASSGHPGSPAEPGRPAQPERTYKIDEVLLGPDPTPNNNQTDPGPPVGIRISCTSGCDSVPPTQDMNFVIEPPAGSFPPGYFGAGGQPARDVPTGDLTLGGNQNRLAPRKEGRYGDNGDDGWGVEICIFSCWTIGESAENGDPGEAGGDNLVNVTTTNNGPNNGAIVSVTDNGPGIWATSRGGNGGQGGDAWGALPAGSGGAAGAGGLVNVTSNVNISTSGVRGYGIWAQSQAGFGGDGGNGYIFSSSGNGGPAAEAGNSIATNNGDGVNNGRIITTGDNAIGIYVQSIGGGGGNAGSAYGVVGDAGSAAFGGNAHDATAINNAYVATSGVAAHGVMAQSVGGKGGNGGDVSNLTGIGGGASGGGDGATAIASNSGTIITQGLGSVGLYAQSVGGGGGDGGDGGGITSVGGSGGAGGNGKTATATNAVGGDIFTTGSLSYGILAQSIGGGGGNGGSSSGISAIGGGGTSGGRGEHATANNYGSIETQGTYATAMVVQSIGGGGGAGGQAGGVVAIGGSSQANTYGADPNNGGEVDANNFADGAILTGNRAAHGILAQSIGGGGGAGGGANGVVGVGGSGGTGGNGWLVDVLNQGSIQTRGEDSKGILAQSIGGGGGSAGNAGGVVGIGGSGAGGGGGGNVTITNDTSAVISTRQRGADGILAQSIGGGGGNGGSSTGVSTIGGSGSTGGEGGTVTVINRGSIYTGLDVITPGLSDTAGAWARGILAQSIGGGGGTGGDAGGAIGGTGGNGGAGSKANTVTVTNSGLIATRGNLSSAIEAQSIGGGGGSGGSGSAAFVSVGGNGGDGGAGGKVIITNDRDLATLGDDSHGIFAQSIGGGGGNGGSSTTLTVFGGVGIGGAAGKGGAAETVTINAGSNINPLPSIHTQGDRAKGILAQSVGGGGGNGGFAATVGGGYIAAASASVGGKGGDGGKSSVVQINGDTSIFTEGLDADGIVAQSVGGSGGNGGFALSFAFAPGDVAAAAFSASVGGRGGGGGDGNIVRLRDGGDILTTGNLSDGIVAQSIGGGGGNGGFAVAISATAAAGANAGVSTSVGGDGGAGGKADLVDAQYGGSIRTEGDDAFGMVLQSVGGGGGNGGFTVSGAVVGSGGGSAGVAVGVGGAGGAGGAGGKVLAAIDGGITTLGDRSTGLVAQSIGGRGGNGGFNISGAITGSGGGAGSVAVGVGGAGAGGGAAETVDVTLNGDAATGGDDADAVVVQSIGGGGGNGGMNVSGTLTGAGGGAGGVAVGVGGEAGSASNGNVVHATVNGDIDTFGRGSNALIAQSIGGSGGNGGMNVSGQITGSGGAGGGVAVGIGGGGGAGGNGMAVFATLTGNAATRGDNATAIIAQSLGGGGGNGGMTASGGIVATGGAGGGVAVGVGGSGGGAGNSDLTTLRITGNVDTVGANSGGVLAQSLGGGGGNGGMAVVGQLTASGAGAGGVAVGVGGSGGSGGTGGAVDARIEGNVRTRGAQSMGVTAQSIGGGGGNGGMAVSGVLTASGSTGGAVAVGVGGSGGTGGTSSRVDADLFGDVTTEGDNSTGFLAQSLGGGGGNGGMTVTASLTASGANAGAVAVGIGGSGGGGGDGNVVDASVTGHATTRGANSAGVVAQSLGGGGGNGGLNVTTALTAGGSASGSVAVGVGGSGGGAGLGRLTTLAVDGEVDTWGDNSAGVIAQSLGGGGGNGGINVSGAITAAGQQGAAVAVGVGGAGGGGGNAGVVNATVDGAVRTRGDNSIGFIAQSIGGGGGNGALNATGTLTATGSSGGSIAVGVGGGGGGAGNGAQVTATMHDGTVATTGASSHGVLVQSVGGGGGSGGMNVSGAVAGSASGAGAVAVGVGGSAGGGGSAARAIGDIEADVYTAGDDAYGVIVQSIGGGGGNGAMNVSGSLGVSNGGAAALSVGVGGRGGVAGHGLDVDATVNGDIATTGNRSVGVLAQSVGGGGGNGGTNVTGALSLSKETGGAVSVGVGGFGGAGGNADLVGLLRTGSTYTEGENAHGVIAQSIGGGGGNGGMNVSAGVAASAKGNAMAAAFGLGGFGGGGGEAKAVNATVIGDVIATGHGTVSQGLDDDGNFARTIADGSFGVLAQSVGGSGGNGGMNISGGIAFDRSNQGSSYALSLGVGGFGGSGGNAGAVTLNLTAAKVKSVGDDRFGVGAQSVGGGGGNGGMNISGGISMDGVITAGIGGFGGAGGTAGAVNAIATTDITAVGTNAIGFFAQSLGGGGGNGGINISGGIQGSSDTDKPTLNFGLGGFGGAGNVSGTVDATQRGNVTVQGLNSIGVLAQSVAGGGGAGALNVTGSLVRGKGYNASIGIGGTAGDGADAQRVTLISDGDVRVDGSEAPEDDDELTPEQLAQLDYREHATGILVQSIGGGGGAGGMNLTGLIAPMGKTLTVGVGGSGGGGGDAGEVYVERGQIQSGLIETWGNASGGLIAQSIGGGGGNAGVNMMYSKTDDDGRAINLGVGGNGGTPGVGRKVDVLHTGDITTHGNRSFGLLAQSVGGGGGSADYNVSDNQTKASAVNIAIGGSTGPGGDSGEVLVNHTGNISTEGDTAIAIFAQSVGGGGGSAGTDFVASSDSEKGFSLQMGRAGGTGGDGGHVRVESNGILSTDGWRAFGIYAQSVGGGGGESSSNSVEVLTKGKQEGSDKAASLEVGIAGATGGVARNVDVIAHGGIFTGGDEAHGIFAQSTGGGGGSGGGIERQPAATASQQIVVGVGGSGGDGGIGGAVMVDSDADIETEGDKAHGIYAQSVGGGGGTGGYSVAVDQEPDSEGPTSRTIAVSIGGEGGTGSYSNTVDVTNRGNIVTHGYEAHGINAESTGGGGGAGGAVLSVVSMSDDLAQSLSVNVGGKGGDGGTSDDVTVLNEGSIETEGDNAVGVRARSVGGKGGDGGLVMNMGLLKATPGQKIQRLSMNVGGDGAIGGVAGDVEVTNRAQAGVEDTGVIITHGMESHGVFAQSIGGGGGNGSSVLSSTLGVSMSAQVTVLDMNLGGKGGQGSKAGNVTVTNDSVIDTEGDKAHGIFAQSIGGGGGNGGLVLAANALLAAGEPATEGLVTLGGAGGTGDDAGDVVVNNNGRIVTRGDHAHGIFAQSIGGGGGNAGVGFGASLNPGTMAIAGVMSALIGGKGGDGGLGGHVTVNHTGDITVLGNGSRAVVAESINGGGGEVVLDFNGVATLPGVPDKVYDMIELPSGIEPTSSLVFFGGGDHQGSSNAGKVTLNLHGTFGVAGNNGAANSVQAVGGGGGTYDLGLALADVVGTADDVTIEGRLGGVSGTDNRGGDIESTHDGDLVTEGDNTVGAMVQSIGGGGGRANLDVSSTYGSLGDTTLTLGGEDGNNEEGGDIEHTQAGATSTQGAASHGGVFQSVGGGGGSLSLMVAGGTQSDAVSTSTAVRERRIYKTAQGAPAAGDSKINLGSNGGAQLKGGGVSLQLDGGISTEGGHALGLIFQSVGAGGGVATVLGVDQLDVTLGGAADASGDGGSVSVVNTGDVITGGERAHGVFLQSIGGGGGAVFTNAATSKVDLSAQNSGSGGNLSFTQNGTVATQGALAYAVFAQSVGGGGGFVDASFAGSAGGTGSAGSIDLDLDGDVLALGEGSTGLFAQSTGADGLGGNITATLAADKRLLGGMNGIAVQFDGGAANRFTNYGSLATRSGPTGLAFKGGAGGDYIDNFGGLMGNIDLGGGANGFANNVGAALYSGTLINLGDPSNVFTNNGLISPGADRLAVETQLFGSYVQSATGVADLELDFGAHAADRLMATGTASVGGRINLSLLNTHAIQSGTTWQPLFNGARGVSNAGVSLHAPESIVIHYDLYRYPTELGVAYDVDFAAHGQLNGNRAAVGEYLNRVTSQGGTTGVGDVIATAVAQTSVDVYADMLTQLDTEFYAEQQAIALGGTQRFARNLQNCGTLSIGETVGDENGCLWARYDDNPSSREAVGGFPAAESNGFSISSGLQRPLDGGWTIGVAIDVEDHDSRGFDDLWTAQGKFMQLGGSARRDLGRGSWGATLQLGNQSQDVTRLVGVTGAYQAKGSRDVDFISNVLDYTWNFDAGGFSVQPSVNLGTALLSYGDMTEQGAGGQNAVIAGGDETHVWIEPAVGARYTANFGSGASLRTFVRAGVLQYLSGTSTGVRAGLAGAPDYAGYMDISSDLDRTHFVGEAGLQYQAAGGFTFGFSYSHQQSDFREGGAGSLRFALPLQ